MSMTDWKEKQCEIIRAEFPEFRATVIDGYIHLEDPDGTTGGVDGYIHLEDPDGTTGGVDAMTAEYGYGLILGLRLGLDLARIRKKKWVGS